MKTILFTLFTFITILTNAQTTYTYTGTGDWDVEENWSPNYPGKTINVEDKVIISTGSVVAIKTLTINGKLTNYGELVSSSFFKNNGIIINENKVNSRSIVENKGVLTNNGTWESSSFFNNSSEFYNNGTFNSYSFFYGNNVSHTGDFNLTTLFNPGSTSSSSVGKYIFDDNLTLSSSLTLTSDISSATEADLIEVKGTVTLSGTLNVKLIDDFIPTLGATYTILTASSVSGTFKKLNFPDTEDGTVFEVSYTANSVILKVVKESIIYTYTGIGDWDVEENWSPSYPGRTINVEDEAIISAGSIVSSNNLTINGKLTNNGELTSSSSFKNNGIVINENKVNSRSIVENKGVLTNNGTWESSSFFNNSSVLNNNGNFNSYSFFYGNNVSHTGDFNLTTLFNPGSTSSSSVGKYIFDDNLTLSNSLTLTSDISSATEADLIEVKGSVTLSGTLKVKLTDDFIPALGTTYTILTASSVSGTFSKLILPDLEDGNVFNVSYNSDSVVLEVVESSLLSIGDDIVSDFIKVVIYPNPALEVLNIDGLLTSQKATIYSILGTKIQVFEVTPSDNKIMINNLSNGFYILSVGNVNYRFLKQ
jgi:hypothetical protein